MSNNKEKENASLGQKIFDNIFLLLILSLLISTGLYNIWGLVQIFSVPKLTP